MTNDQREIHRTKRVIEYAERSFGAAAPPALPHSSSRQFPVWQTIGKLRGCTGTGNSRKHLMLLVDPQGLEPWTNGLKEHPEDEE